MNAASAEAVAIDQELRSLCRTQQRAAHRCAVLLAQVAAQNLHLEFGYTSVLDYAVRGLDLTTRKARDLLRLGGRMPEFPAVEAAFAEGRLPWTKARELLPVVTQENQDQWVERAGKLSNRELEIAVRAATGATHVGPTDRPKRGRLVLVGDASRLEQVRETIAALRVTLGIDPADQSDLELVADALEQALADRAAPAEPPAAQADPISPPPPDAGGLPSGEVSALPADATTRRPWLDGQNVVLPGRGEGDRRDGRQDQGWNVADWLSEWAGRRRTAAGGRRWTG